MEGGSAEFPIALPVISESAIHVPPVTQINSWCFKKRKICSLR
jgi:hypothetical protein